MGGTVTVHQLDEYQDAFGTPVVKGTRNTLDLPAFYDFSEERYRFMMTGHTPDANTAADVDVFVETDQDW